jgi:hypothetical protein
MSRNRKGSRTGPERSPICAFARYRPEKPVGRLALALSKKASPPRQIPRACPRGVEGRRATAAPFRQALATVGRVGATPLFTETCSPRARTLTAMRALVPPRTRPPASDRPTSAAGQISAERAEATCPAAKGCYSQTVLRPKAARVVRSGGSRVPASTERFAGKTPDRWQSTGAAATCRGAPLPCRGATAIPARNPGPADPNCRTVP